ncbi:ABC transporter substrate-binding protein [Haloarchaeobius sp. TZWSO28]|uniref:ABC transporter substrate-binding protein n=1 Tax=Haloarchaeobius sp. TZWSO28 TaxID=3446119 RepID=UPI003EBBEC51
MVDDSHPHSGEGDPRWRGLRRRQYLAAIGAAAGVGLAGCSSQAEDTQTSEDENNDGGSTETSSGGTEEGESESSGRGPAVDPTMNLITGTAPQDMNFWPFFGRSNMDSIYFLPLQTWYGAGQLAQYTGGEYDGLLVAESRLINDFSTWEIKLDTEHDWTWHDGDPVTIDDLYEYDKYFHEYDKLLGNTPDWKSVTRVDDTTIHRELHERTAPFAFFHTNQRPNIHFQGKHAKKFREMMEDASTEKSAADINKQATEADEIGFEDAVGNGMFEVSEIADDRVVYSKYEDHPFADQQNIENIEILFRGDDSGFQLAFQNDQIDLTFEEPNPQQTQYPDDVSYVTKPQPRGEVYMLNQHNKHLAKVEVRRAMAYYLDSQAIVNNTNGAPVTTQTGAAPVVLDQWLPDPSVADDYIQYGATRQPEKAAAELQKAGYSKNSEGIWEDESGDTLSFIIRTYDWRPTVGRTINSQMRRAGFDVDAKVIGAQEYLNEVYNQPPESGVWDMIFDFHAGSINHPTHSYADSISELKLTNDDGSPGWANRDVNPTVPSTVGAEEVSGSGKTLDLRELQRTLASPDSSIEETKQATHDLAWYWNYSVPSLVFKTSQAAWAFDDTNFVMEDYDGDGYADLSMSYNFSKPTVYGVEK